MRDYDPKVEYAAALLGTLTPQEMRVAICISQGMSQQETAQEMGIGAGNVKNKCYNIYDKLDIKGKCANAKLAAAVAIAKKEGLYGL